MKNKNQYDEFLHKIQQAKMKELWDNKKDEAIIERLESLRLAEKLVQKSQLTAKDVDKFSKKLKVLATQKVLQKQ